MKTKRIAIALLLILSMAALSGCYDSTWSMKLTGIEEADLGEFTILPNAFIGADWSPSPKGLELDNYYLFLPYNISADFTFTATFLTETTETCKVNIEFGAANNRLHPTSLLQDDFVKFSAYELGSSAPYSSYEDCGDKSGSKKSNSYPGSSLAVVKNGLNVIQLTRRGDTYTAKLNGKSITSFTAVNCSPASLFPFIYADQINGGKAYFTNIKLEYDM